MHKENLVGQRFGRLLVVEELPSNDKKYKRPRWKCLCDCGMTTILRRGDALKNGNTTSCGCKKSEVSSKRLSVVALNNRKYEPKIATAMEVYKTKYSDGTLTFDQFFTISQQNCYYCGCVPSNVRNTVRNGASSFFVKNCTFTYNGIDRVDNELRHDVGNCVPCCKTCNFTKRNMPLENFYKMIESIYHYKKNDIDYRILFIRFDKDTTEFKRIKGQLHKIYKDINFEFELLSFILTLECYYCGTKNSNRTKCKNGDIIFRNGLDRIDQSKGHTLDNIVPCCKQCNLSKGKRNRDEFLAWIKHVYHFKDLKNSSSLSDGSCPIVSTMSE